MASKPPAPSSLPDATIVPRKSAWRLILSLTFLLLLIMALLSILLISKGKFPGQHQDDRPRPAAASASATPKAKPSEKSTKKPEEVSRKSAAKKSETPKVSPKPSKAAQSKASPKAQPSKKASKPPRMTLRKNVEALEALLNKEEKYHLLALAPRLQEQYTPADAPAIVPKGADIKFDYESLQRDGNKVTINSKLIGGYTGDFRLTLGQIKLKGHQVWLITEPPKKL